MKYVILSLVIISLVVTPLAMIVYNEETKKAQDAAMCKQRGGVPVVDRYGHVLACMKKEVVFGI